VLNRPLDRADAPLPTLSREELLGNAPDASVDAGLFKVPRVIG
jgi:Asp-tRNA(Asn)/Glu-tRNA(Gln) amidotransferase C subunit